MGKIERGFLTTYHILLAEFGELPIELYALKLTMGFQQRLVRLSPSWLVSKAISLFQHLAEQGIKTWYISTTMWKILWVLSYWEIHANPTTSNTTYVDVKEAFLAKEWNSYHLYGRNEMTFTSRIILNTNVTCTWSNH